MSSAAINDFIQKRIDNFYSIWPQQLPSKEKLLKCKIIGHRGQHDNFNVFENTLPAFETCVRNKIWGIELDLRWTEDLHPVVLHDADCGRVFGRPQIAPANYSLQLLKQHAPFIPTLQEVVDQFGLNIHLMIEIKESLSDPDNVKVTRLQEILYRLRPGQDYHFMSFSSEFLRRINFAPPSTCLGIAEWNLKEMSEQCLKNRFGGLTGHYLLLNKDLIETHHLAKQRVGVGFISSPNSLFREINRGVDWLFTNHPLQTKHWLDAAIRRA